MKRLCYLGILKEGLSAYLDPVMLISRKVIKDKRVVTAFRHLNARIGKTNFAYLLLKDTLSVLGSSLCDVLSVLDLKDAFLISKAFRKFKKILWNLTIFWYHLIFISKNAYGIEYISSIGQSYINVILDYLQSRKYCKAIMDDLLLFIPMQKSHMVKLEDLLKALL